MYPNVKVKIGDPIPHEEFLKNGRQNPNGARDIIFPSQTSTSEYKSERPSSGKDLSIVLTPREPVFVMLVSSEK